MNPRVAVIGAGVAGLFAAVACRRAGQGVALLERDRRDETGPRPGVPQGPQPHVYLLRGLIAAERLLPGLRRELFGAGAVPFDTTRSAWLAESGWYPTGGRAFEVLSITRPLFESVVRRMVLNLGGIDLRGGHRVTALVRSEPGQDGHWRVECDDADPVVADLVVDASGRGTRILTWLDALGVPRPSVTHIDAKVGYATRMYTGAPDLGRLSGIVLQAHPARPTGAAVLPVENGRWLVGLGGYGENRPPRDEEGFNEFARALADPCVADFIAAARPCTAVAIHRQTENRYHHFERIRDWPDRLVVIGDAFVSFNPIYGQGITVAAGQAEILHRTLGAGRPNLDTRRLMRRFAAMARLPWEIATGQDLRQPSCTGRPSRAQNLSTAWALTIQRLAVHGNLGALGALNRLYHLAGSPAVLLHPALLAAVARARLVGQAPASPRPLDLPSRAVGPDLGSDLAAE